MRSKTGCPATSVDVLGTRTFWSPCSWPRPACGARTCCRPPSASMLEMADGVARLPEELPVTQPRYVGQDVPRVEDPMLLTGRVEYADNIRLPGMLHAAILRSPHARARIVRIDTSRA